MIRWALRFITNRLILMGMLLLVLNGFSQGSSCQSGNSQGLARTLTGLPEALKALNGSFR